jgi:hypothetical protein
MAPAVGIPGASGFVVLCRRLIGATERARCCGASRTFVRVTSVSTLIMFLHG